LPDTTPPTTLTYADTGHLHTISNGYGGLVSYAYEKIEYGTKTIYARHGEKVDGEDPDTDRWRVTNRIIDDYTHENSNTLIYNYSYAAPVFMKGTFKGHQLITVTDPDGNRTKTFFLLGFYNAFLSASERNGYGHIPALIGKPYRTQVLDQDSILSQTELVYYTYGVRGGKIKKSETLMGNAPTLVTSYEYNEYGDMERVDNNDRITTIEYDPLALNPHLPKTISQYVDAVQTAQTVYTYTFYANGYATEDITVTQRNFQEGGHDLLSYQHFDSIGNVDSSWTGSSEYATTVEYDSTYQTFPAIVTYANGDEAYYEYDARFGLVKSSTDVRGATTTYGYDSFGRPKTIVGEYTDITYNYNDVNVGTTDNFTVSVKAFGLNDYLVQSYNGLGQLYQEKRADSSLVSYGYDGQGRVVTSTLPYTSNNSTTRRELETSYDALGRPLSVETRDAITKTLYAYPSWQTVIVTDAQGITTTYQMDSLGRVELVSNAGGSTSYTYIDSATPSMRITDPSGNKTFIYYDNLGRKVSMNDPDMGLWKYTYDERGNLFTQEDARGITTTLIYDEIGRPTDKTYTIPDGSSVAATAPVHYEYPSPTRMEMTDGSGQTVWEYDVTGRLLSEAKTIDGHTFTTGYGYNTFGLMETMTYPDGEVITYSYNIMNQVEHVFGQDVYLKEASYDLLGQPIEWNLSDDTEQVIQYNSFTFRPEAMLVEGATHYNFSFAFDAVGRLDRWANNYDQEDEWAGSDWLDMSYDGLNRLDDVDSNIISFQQDYGYDLIGNLTNRNGLGLTYPTGVEPPHLPTSDSQGTTYAYDNNGNMLDRTLSSGTVISYTYDAENQLTKVVSTTGNSEITTDLIYNGNNELVVRVASDIKHIYVGDYIEFVETQQLNSAAYSTNVSNTPSVDSGNSCIALDELGIANFVWEDAGDSSITFQTLDSHPVTLDTNNVGDPSIAIGLNGRIHVVWSKSWMVGSTPVEHIYYRYFADGLWSTPVQVSNVSISGAPQEEMNRNPSIVVDVDGNIHIVWHGDVYSPTPSRIYHRFVNANGTWSSIDHIPNFTVDSDEYVVDTVADIHGVHMVWGTRGIEIDSKIFYSRWDSIGWVDTNEFTQIGKNPTVDVGDNGTVHVAWASPAANQLTYYSYKNANGWSVTEFIPGSSNAPSIAAGDDGEVYLAVGDSYTFRDSSGWLSPTPIFAGSSSFDTSACRMVYDGASAHLTYNADSGNGNSDVYYLRLQAYDVIKRYSASGQQIATRLADNDLYYHVYDPTGTSLVMVDADDGEEVGRMLYDGFGGVLTSTLPLTLTGTLPDMPDAATGLVHLGGGRWYDPALGRPLQPNPAGGPPTVPQALNRYAATAVGQPGVAAANDNSHSLTNASLVAGFAKTVAFETIGRATAGSLGQSVINSVHRTGRSVIAFQASATSLSANRIAIEVAGGVFEGSRNETRRLLTSGILSKNKFRTDLFRFETTLDEAGALTAKLRSTGSLVDSGGWRATTSIDSIGITYGSERVARFSILNKWYVGGVADFTLSSVFQYIEDSQNPYFRPKQRFARAGIAGVGSFLAGVGGTAIGSSLGCGPYAPICIASSGVVLGAAWAFGVQPMIFEAVPFLQPPPRNLLPLN